MNSITLSSEESELSSTLQQQIFLAAKQQDQRLSFADYMQMALYSPSLGYYQNGLKKFGEAGDFITAPEMGDVLAMALVESIADYWRNLPEQKRHLIEFGGGSGALAQAMIRLLSQAGMAACDYTLIEPSAALQAQQHEKIAAVADKAGTTLSWSHQLPKGFCGVVLANEVVDAMPCERICLQADGWHYLDVALPAPSNKQGENNWHWAVGERFDKALPLPLNDSGTFPDNYKTEIRYLQKPWLQMIHEAMQEGLVCLLDYGYSEQEYYHPQRHDGTLMTFIRHHQSANPFLYPGLQDISVHVDFTALARDALSVGFDMPGYTTQAGFILDCGILTQLEQQMMNAGSEQRLRLSQQIQKLMLPGQMGETIKVMMLSKGDILPPGGFDFNEQSHRL